MNTPLNTDKPAFALGRGRLGLILLLLAFIGLGGAGLAWLLSGPSVPESAVSDAPPQGDIDPVLAGHLAFTAYHELGHALVSELDLPVLGKEEDAVDRLAIWILTPDDPQVGPDALIGSMQSWFRSAEQTAYADIAWWGEHSSDEQRAFQIACLLYGSDPARFAAVADTAGLPEDRQASCQVEAEANDRAWATVLTPHLRPDTRPARLDTVTITYEPAGDFAHEAALLRQMGLLEELKALIEQDFTLRPGLTLTAQVCGEANAFWDPEARQLVICYELVRDYQALAEGV